MNLQAEFHPGSVRRGKRKECGTTVAECETPNRNSLAWAGRKEMTETTLRVRWVQPDGHARSVCSLTGITSSENHERVAVVSLCFSGKQSTRLLKKCSAEAYCDFLYTSVSPWVMFAYRFAPVADCLIWVTNAYIKEATITHHGAHGSDFF